MVQLRIVRFDDTATIDRAITPPKEKNRAHLVAGLALGLAGLAEGITVGVSHGQGYPAPQYSVGGAVVLEVLQAFNSTLYFTTLDHSRFSNPRMLTPLGFISGVTMQAAAEVLGYGIGYFAAR